MRVLHVIPSVSPRRGGPSAAIFPMVAALRARGIDAEIATSDEDEGSIEKTFPSYVAQHGVPVRIFARWRAPVRLLQEYSFCPRFVPWLKENLWNYDLIHVHALFSHLPSAAMRIARRCRVPYVNRPLGLLGRWPLRQSALRKKLYLRLIEKRNLDGAAAFHFTSEPERDEAADVMAVDRSVIIPHGMETPELLVEAGAQLRSRLGLPRNQKLVLFLGRIHHKKGIDWLVRSLAQMYVPRPVLLIAGEGDQRAGIEQLASRLGIDRNLRWLGHVAGEWKQLCLQGSDLLALTSHHENFGVAVLEALAAGTPVLVSDHVALAEVIARHRLGRVVPLEIGAIRDGLTQALAESDGDSLARRREFVRDHYSWSASAAALEQLYRRTIENHTGRTLARRLQHAQPPP
jgi:glycosyltransferase involved in cell wall biosynthesis